EATEVEELGGGEGSHLAGHVGDYLREEGGDEGLSLGGQLHDYEATVGGIALALHVAGLFQLIHDEREVAAALEEFLGQLTLAKRPDVVKGLEHAKLRGGEILREHAVHTCRHRLRRPLKLDEGVQGVDLFDRAAVSCSHGKDSCVKYYDVKSII